MIILNCFCFEERILNIHVQNLDLCLTRELLKFLDDKTMLKLQCKITFNSAFVVKNFI